MIIIMILLFSNIIVVCGGDLQSIHSGSSSERLHSYWKQQAVVVPPVPADCNLNHDQHGKQACNSRNVETGKQLQ